MKYNVSSTENGKIFDIKTVVIVLFGTWLPFQGSRVDLLLDHCDTEVSRETGGYFTAHTASNLRLYSFFVKLTLIVIRDCCGKMPAATYAEIVVSVGGL